MVDQGASAGASGGGAGAPPRFSDASRRALLTAAGRFADAVVVHAQVLSSVAGPSGLADVAEAADELSQAAADYLQAQEAHAGPEAVELLEGEPDEGAPRLAVVTPGGAPPSGQLGLTLLQRVDVAVADERALLTAAGQLPAAFPADSGAGNGAGSGADSGAGSPSASSPLALAVLRLLAAGGTQAVLEAPGAQATGACTVVLERDELLDDDEGSWPEDPFDVDGDLLCRLDEVRASDGG